MPPVQPGVTAAQSQAAQAANALQANAQIRAAILNSAIEVKQSIYSNTINTPGQSANVLNIPFRAVGLIKGFIVEVALAMSNTGSGAASLTNWNAANALSNVTLYDLDNYQRLNVAGWYLHQIATAKEGFPHGAALLSTAMDTPVKYGNNFSAISATSSLAATSGTGTVKMYYWVPCAYSASDLRGSIFSGVVNATGYLQLTINPTPGAATGDPTLAIYTGANTAVTITSATINVYQVYLDQLPRYQGGPNNGAPILPPIDIATQYRLNTTTLTGVVTSQDFPVPFTNFQQFLSLGLIYDQNGTLNGGSDLNYFALAAANTYVPFKLDPITQAWLSRHKILTDWPLGSYMFDFRNQPINTNQTGNMQLLLNAITAASGTSVLAGFEAFALTTSVLGAASLPAS